MDKLKGPDYNSESEIERAQEMARLKALLKDWETASAGSRSLPATPKKRPVAPPTGRSDGVRSADPVREVPLPPRVPERVYVSQIPQSVIHQSYGVVQPQYRQVTYNNPNYVTQSPSHQMTYPSAMQYQAISPMYANQPTAYQPPSMRPYSSYNQHSSPIKTFVNNSSSHMTYDQPVTYSPSHRVYGMPMPAPPPTATLEINSDAGNYLPGSSVKTLQNPPNKISKSDGDEYQSYTNGELLQQHLYSQHSMQYQQYKEAREQVLAQNQQHQGPIVYRGPSKNYQSSVTIPIVMKGGQSSDVNMLHRKQYELT